jgi:hypothetical protein
MFCLFYWNEANMGLTNFFILICNKQRNEAEQEINVSGDKLI